MQIAGEDIILISKDDIVTIGLSMSSLVELHKKAYHGEWRNHGISKEEYLSDPVLAEQVKRIDSTKLAARITDIGMDIHGNLVGKVSAYGPQTRRLHKAMSSRKGVKVVPRIEWVRVPGTIGDQYYKPNLVTFDVGSY